VCGGAVTAIVRTAARSFDIDDATCDICIVIKMIGQSQSLNLNRLCQYQRWQSNMSIPQPLSARLSECVFTLADDALIKQSGIYVIGGQLRPSGNKFDLWGNGSEYASDCLDDSQVPEID